MVKPRKQEKSKEKLFDSEEKKKSLKSLSKKANKFKMLS